jgi:hypothetical protein
MSNKPLYRLYKEQPWGIFYAVVFALLLSVFFGYFAKHLVVFLTSVDKVVQQKSVLEFQQSINQVHAKWLSEKGEVVTLSLVENINLQQQGRLAVTVNHLGWPIGIVNNQEESKNCRLLWDYFQSHSSDKVRVVELMNSDDKATGCGYFNADEPLFEYLFHQGKIKY